MANNYPPGFEYPDFAPMFKAELFDPNEWAKYLSDSGAKWANLHADTHSVHPYTDHQCYISYIDNYKSANSLIDELL